MMTMQEFVQLSEMSQIELLYESGVYIGKKNTPPHTILLYQIEGFYVEIHYKRHRCDVAYIRCFDSTDLIEPYLEKIEIGISV